MDGLMQDWQLSVPAILDHAANFHGKREVVSRLMDGSIHRYGYGDCHLRSRKLAQALEKLGVREGDPVGTLAWNTMRHVEAWYGVPGMGGVCHTINPRLFHEQIVYIANHAEDRVLLADTDQAELLEAIADKLESVDHIVFLCERDEMPETSLSNVLCYEDLLAEQDGDYRWKTGDENRAAGMCYTSGTTGNPKGVVYSHRAIVLHAMACSSADLQGLRCAETIMPITPMFHANCWGLIHNTPMWGAKLVLCGRGMDPASLHELANGEAVTMASGVPTIWLSLVDWLEENDEKLDTLNDLMVGGSAMPRSLTQKLEDEYGVRIGHAWGMTELTPVGTTGLPTARVAALTREEQLDFKTSQGRGIFGVEMKITDDDGNALPWDGETSGHLLVRGPWVAEAYYKGEGGDIVDADGWFDTGDIATIDGEGYMRITDRAKDVIKSGGEWISSIDLENEAVGHPGVAEAAVIGLPHPKWDERPLLVVVRKKGTDATKDEIIDYLRGKVAKWWLPDDVAFVEELPHTATGKISKRHLRDRFSDYAFPETRGSG